MGAVLPVTDWTYGRLITPNDTPDANSSLYGAKYLYNPGTAGNFTVTQATTADGQKGIAPTASSTMVVYLASGGSIECGGSWRSVRATGLGAGVILYALH